MTSESGADREPAPRVKFGPTFAACSTARTLIGSCGLVLFGTGSFVADLAGLTRHLPPLHPKMADYVGITCVVSYILACFISIVGTISIFIHGLDRSGEIVIRGSRYRGMVLSKIALSIYTLPWILLGGLLATGVLR